MLGAYCAIKHDCDCSVWLLTSKLLETDWWLLIMKLKKYIFRIVIPPPLLVILIICLRVDNARIYWCQTRGDLLQAVWSTNRMTKNDLATLKLNVDLAKSCSPLPLPGWLCWTTLCNLLSPTSSSRSSLQVPIFRVRRVTIQKVSVFGPKAWNRKLQAARSWEDLITEATNRYEVMSYVCYKHSCIDSYVLRYI